MSNLNLFDILDVNHSNEFYNNVSKVYDFRITWDVKEILRGNMNIGSSERLHLFILNYCIESIKYEY